MFHDLGLNEQFRTDGRRFEVDSADEARKFLQSHRVPEDSIRRVWTAIALHTSPGIPQFMEPEVALVTAGVEYDVLGIGYDDISDSERAEVTALHPRPHFKRRILQAFTDGIAPKPETTFGNVTADVLEQFVPGFRRGDFVEIILNSAWPQKRNRTYDIRESREFFGGGDFEPAFWATLVQLASPTPEYVSWTRCWQPPPVRR